MVADKQVLGAEWTCPRKFLHGIFEATVLVVSIRHGGQWRDSRRISDYHNQWQYNGAAQV